MEACGLRLVKSAVQQPFRRPVGSCGYGIFTYIGVVSEVNVGKHSIHGVFGHRVYQHPNSCQVSS